MYVSNQEPIRKTSLRAKRASLWLTLTETKPDIIIGCETWLYPGIHEKEVLPAGYYFVARKDREANCYVGVIIAAKDNICGTELDADSTSEIVAASFNDPNNSQLVICSTYRPPSSDLTYMKTSAQASRSYTQRTRTPQSGLQVI
jgi:exonuclease III